MKRLLAFAVVLTLVASPAMAGLSDHGDRASAPIYTATDPVAIGGGASRDTTPYQYDSLYGGTGGYFAATAALGPLGLDDYQTVNTHGTPLTAIKFIGGVTAPGGVLWFEFYQHIGGTGTSASSFAFATSFGVQLPSSGNFIWTINLGSPAVIPPGGTAASSYAYMQIVANTTYTAVPTTIAGQWFMTTTDAVIVGGNDPLFGGGVGSTTGGATFPLVHDFAFTPEPASLALLGAGLLFVVRRRR